VQQAFPAINFQQLMKENAQVLGQKDEIKRMYESLRNDLDAFKRQLEEKEKAKEMEVRSLQAAMGDICSENERLKEENESKPSLLDRYYKNVLENSSSTRALLDLNAVPPSEIALEGALVVLTTMYSRPVELAGASQTIDFFNSRSVTKFSNGVPSLRSLGLDMTNKEHVFFLQCYMKYPTDPSFCLNGVLDSASSVVTLPPGGACAPRASVLRKTPRRFQNIFFAQTASQKVSKVGNASHNLQQGGGLTEHEPLPSEVHSLLATFCASNLYKNPIVPLSTQFVSYIQNGLTSLDAALLKYQSPVYKLCPLKRQSYKNGRTEVVKDKAHPAFDKWDSLIIRNHFDKSYATTRITFPWKGFNLPGGHVLSHRDKYAFFAFTSATDLIRRERNLKRTSLISQQSTFRSNFQAPSQHSRSLDFSRSSKQLTDYSALQAGLGQHD
jgi:hypothetical protein